MLERDYPNVPASRESLARILWVQKDPKAKWKEAGEQINKVMKVREKRQAWGHSDIQRAANLFIEIGAEGKEKEQLRKKIMKSTILVNTDGTFSEESDMGLDPL